MPLPASFGAPSALAGPAPTRTAASQRVCTPPLHAAQPRPRGGRRRAAPTCALPPGTGRPADVVALSNLCVDIVQHVPRLPPKDEAARRAVFTELVAAAPAQSQWEVGGNTNFAIAAARLGLSCTCLGHTGRDAFGKFMEDVLAQEGVALQQLLEPGADAPPTLLCWVLIDPANGHDFCSRFDFDTRPLLHGAEVPAAWETTLRSAKAVFVNGFVFDDLEPSTVLAAVRAAHAGGADVCFDGGPRVRALARDVPRGGAAALRELLAHADAVMLTQDEAEAVTGLHDADEAAAALLAASQAEDPWIVVKRGSRGCTAHTRRDRAQLRALPVEALDTVGCGDSFAAAVVLGRIRSHELRPTLALANAVGAATATGRGAGRNVARAEHVARLLAEAARNEAAPAEERAHAAAAQKLLAPQTVPP